MGVVGLLALLSSCFAAAAFLAAAAGAHGGLDRVSRARLEHEAAGDDDLGPKTPLGRALQAPRALQGALELLGDAARVGFTAAAWFLGLALVAPGALAPAERLLATGAAVLVVLFFGAELVPDALAARHAERVTRALGRPLHWLLLLAAPARALAVLLLPARLVPASTPAASPVEAAPGIDEDEFRELVDESTEAGVVGAQEQALIHKILDFGDRRVREVMTPFDRIYAVPEDATVDRVVRDMAERKYSRVPVYRRSPRRIVGVLYAKDLLPIRWQVAPPRPLRVLLRRPLYVEPQLRAQVLLERFRSRRLHMAIVVDERGDAVGLCTMEDLLEELVGPITDVAAERKGEEGPP